MRRPFQSSVFDRGSLDLEEREHALRARDGVMVTRAGRRYAVRLEEAVGGRVLRVVDAQLGTVAGIFELVDAAELGADAATYVEDIGGLVRTVRASWKTGEVVELGSHGTRVA